MACSWRRPAFPGRSFCHSRAADHGGHTYVPAWTFATCQGAQVCLPHNCLGPIVSSSNSMPLDPDSLPLLRYWVLSRDVEQIKFWRFLSTARGRFCMATSLPIFWTWNELSRLFSFPALCCARYHCTGNCVTMNNCKRSHASLLVFLKKANDMTFRGFTNDMTIQRIYKNSFLTDTLAGIVHLLAVGIWQRRVIAGSISVGESEELMHNWTPCIVQGANHAIRLDSISSIAVTKSGQQLKRQMRIFVEQHDRWRWDSSCCLYCK